MPGTRFGARIPISGPVCSVDRLIESSKLAQGLNYVIQSSYRLTVDAGDGNGRKDSATNSNQ